MMDCLVKRKELISTHMEKRENEEGKEEKEVEK